MHRKRRALITGITGQDGILLAELLLNKGYDVIGFGRRESLLARRDNIPHFSKLIMSFGDVAESVDIAAAIQDHQPDEVYNLAAQSAPGLSWQKSVETGLATGVGAHRLYEAVRRFKKNARIYQASSSEMFGNVHGGLQNEDTAFRPLNPYGVSKLYAHEMARIYRDSYGMFIACGILFNHESRYRGSHFLSQKVTYGAACVSMGILNSSLLNEEGEPVVKDGKIALGNLSAQRDWGNARDYVDAMWRMLQLQVAEDIVIGTGQLRSVRDLCSIAFGHVGKNWTDHIVTDPRFLRPIETGATVADASKAMRLLHWEAKDSFEIVVREMVDHHRAHLESRPRGKE